MEEETLNPWLLAWIAIVSIGIVIVFAVTVLFSLLAGRAGPTHPAPTVAQRVVWAVDQILVLVGLRQR